MKDPLTITPEEDEEQMIMRRLRNSVDELKRGYRWLDYRMQRIKTKADRDDIVHIACIIQVMIYSNIIEYDNITEDSEENVTQVSPRGSGAWRC